MLAVVLLGLCCVALGESAMEREKADECGQERELESSRDLVKSELEEQVCITNERLHIVILGK